MKPDFFRPFAHIPGVTYPHSSPSPLPKPSPRPKATPKPPKQKQPQAIAGMSGITLRQSPLGFRYAHHPDHA